MMAVPSIDFVRFRSAAGWMMILGPDRANCFCCYTDKTEYYVTHRPQERPLVVLGYVHDKYVIIFLLLRLSTKSLS
jgi:hypothetical protein